MNKQDRISELEKEMEKCCADFKKRIAELKWENPMDGEGLLLNGDGYIQKVSSASQNYQLMGHQSSDAKILEKIRDREKLYNLMFKDSLDSWEGEVDWLDFGVEKWGIDFIEYEDKSILYVNSHYDNFSITPVFKTEKDLLASLEKHRELFDVVHNSKGFEVV